MPTILDYLGAEAGHEIDGRSLRPLLSGDDGHGEWNPRRSVLAEEAHTQRRRMIRAKGKKYIRSLENELICRYCGVEHASSEELYDLQTDPSEQQNLVEDNPDCIRELRERLRERYAELLEAPEPVDRAVSYDDEEEIIDRFEALGYR